MIILVDMDDVLADFEAEFINRWKARHPEKICVEREDRKVIGIIASYPKEYEEHVRAIYTEKNFFNSLPPIKGSIEAVNEIQSMGHDVFLCTAPIMKYSNCVNEKYEWTEKNMGHEWTKRIILTRDKTIVKGDYLIDDNPEITGAAEPAWEQILFDQPYNRNITGKKRMTWDNWKDVIDWKA